MCSSVNPSKDLFFNFIIYLLKYSCLQHCANFCCTAQRPSHTYTYIYICICMYSFPHNICHHVLSQEIIYNTRCCIIGPHCLPNLNVNSLHLLTPNSPSIPLPPPTTLATTSLFSISVILFLIYRQVHLCHILDSTYK